jgi:hypothetical protein
MVGYMEAAGAVVELLHVLYLVQRQLHKVLVDRVLQVLHSLSHCSKDQNVTW